MMKHAQTTCTPINLATAKAAIDGFSRLESSSDLLDLSKHCSTAMETVYTELPEYFLHDELTTLVFALTLTKDIAANKAVATALEEGRRQ